jgi:hypothetical protein
LINNGQLFFAGKIRMLTKCISLIIITKEKRMLPSAPLFFLEKLGNVLA